MKCPRCGRVKTVVVQGDYYHCTFCKILWDDDPSEGGCALSHDPVRSLEKKEAYANRRIERRGPRRAS